MLPNVEGSPQCQWDIDGVLRMRQLGLPQIEHKPEVTRMKEPEQCQMGEKCKSALADGRIWGLG